MIYRKTESKLGLAKASDVANEAKALLKLPKIPYLLGGEDLKGMDCQGMCEYCIRKAGGKISYSGSNSMWRKACTWQGTLREAELSGRLVPGAIVFIKEPKSGGEPAQYRGDGIGDFNHVGIFIGEKNVYSIDASKANGRVMARTERDGTRMCTHAAWFKEIDYSEYTSGIHEEERYEGHDDRETGRWDDVDTLPSKTPDVSGERLGYLPRQVRVKTISGRLNLRQYPRTDSYRLGGIEPGTIAEVLDGITDWYKIRVKVGTQTLTGWAQSFYMEEYVKPQYRGQGARQ